MRTAHAELPAGVVDLEYLVDVEPSGEECLVVYVTAEDPVPEPAEQRRVEALLREALSSVIGYSVYFRWRTDEEAEAERHVRTKEDLLDQPHSALR